uniref:Uncharacterized protein n=1 Tax=Octopus bimaculoides TaxID=37653 RepID=A0A0L8IG84_OCTBM
MNAAIVVNNGREFVKRERERGFWMLHKACHKTTDNFPNFHLFSLNICVNLGSISCVPISIVPRFSF